MVNQALTKFWIAVDNEVNSVREDRDGVTAIEYAVIAVGISAVAMFVFKDDGALGNALKSAFQKIATNINGG